MKALPQKLTTGGPVLIFLAAMLWATDAPFRYHLTRGLDASFIVLAEHTVNVLLILPFIFRGWSEIRQLNWKQWFAILVIGIGASAVASILFTKAFSFVNPSVAIVLQKLQPLIAISLAALFLREQLTRRFWRWAILALIGAYVISFPDFKPELYAGEQWNPNTFGVLLALGAAALWGLGTVLGRYILKPTTDNLPPTTGISFKTLTALRFLIAFLFLIALNLRGGVWETVGALTGKDILFIIIVAVASGFTSLMIYYRGLQHTKASVATLAELGFPFLAVIVNAAALGLFLKPMQVVGMALLLLAVWGLTRVNAQKTELDFSK
ncbi:MAG TPA: DMT family transporter [Candidatus Paceibacterota bacterium]